jgi:hypothetical protein
MLGERNHRHPPEGDGWGTVFLWTYQLPQKDVVFVFITEPLSLHVHPCPSLPFLLPIYYWQEEKKKRDKKVRET